jgi:hypothetical protein
MDSDRKKGQFRYIIKQGKKQENKNKNLNEKN